VSLRARRALLVAGGLAALAGCALGTWWVVPGGAPRIERVRVTVEQAGASAVEIDRTIAAPLAAALSELEGSEVTITSTEGRADAVVELLADGTALDRVRDRLAAMALPESAYPSIARAPRGRSVRWLVRGEHVAERARMMRVRIEAATGHEARTCAREQEVHVIVDADRAAAYGLGAAQVADALSRENAAQPAGRILQGSQEWAIRTHGELDSLDSIGEVVIANRESVPVRVRDVATVAWAPAPDGCACFAGGELCASGAAIADEARAREALRDEEVTWVDAALLFSAPAGTSGEALHRLGESLAEVAAGVDGVREVAIEVSPPASDGPPADLALLLVFERGADPSAILAALREAVTRVPGLLLHPPEGGPEIVIAGDDLDLLIESASAVRGALDELARVVPFGVELAPELRVEIDRARAAGFGAGETDVARAMLLSAHGELASHYREGMREHAIRVRTEGDLETLRVSTASGSVPLGAIATLTHELAPPVLYRCGALRCVRLAVDGDPAALDRARRRLLTVEVPPGVTLRWR